MIQAKAAHGGSCRRVVTNHQITGTASIIAGYSTSRAPKPLPSNCSSPEAKNVATSSWPTVSTSRTTQATAATGQDRAGRVITGSLMPGSIP